MALATQENSGHLLLQNPRGAHDAGYENQQLANYWQAVRAKTRLTRMPFAVSASGWRRHNLTALGNSLAKLDFPEKLAGCLVVLQKPCGSRMNYVRRL